MRGSGMETYLDIECETAGSAGGNQKSAYNVGGGKSALNAETINIMIQHACEGPPITDVQLRQELEEGGDLVDIQSGALTLNGLRLTAETLALMRYPSESERLPDLNREKTDG
jgi:hypothetical protein